MDDYQDNDATDIDILPVPDPAGRLAHHMHGGMYQYGVFNVKSTTQEFRLTSPDRGTLRYVVGLWYGKNDLNRELAKVPLIATTARITAPMPGTPTRRSTARAAGTSGPTPA
jgi:iron complex outermembrane receptor protein